MRSGEGVVTLQSSHSVSESLDRLEKLLHDKGIRVFGRIDHSGEARGVGIEMPPTQLLLFENPKIGTPIMLAAPPAAIDLPSKALAWQDATGAVWLSYNDPEYLKKRFGLCEELLRHIRELGTIIAQAA